MDDLMQVPDLTREEKGRFADWLESVAHAHDILSGQVTTGIEQHLWTLAQAEHLIANELRRELRRSP